MSDGPVVLAGFATLLLVAWFGCSAVSADCIPCNVKVLFLMGRVCLQWAKELMRQAAGAADGRVVHPCADDSNARLGHIYAHIVLPRALSTHLAVVAVPNRPCHFYIILG